MTDPLNVREVGSTLSQYNKTSGKKTSSDIQIGKMLNSYSATHYSSASIGARDGSYVVDGKFGESRQES